jgi:GTP pyrophosphokinase
METSMALDQFWQDKSHIIRQFINIQPNYEKLAEEVLYILKKCVESENVEYSDITHRTKTLDSFCEKASRKGYKDPIEDTTDIAGVRIVFLYISDLSKIEAIVEKNFEL